MRVAVAMQVELNVKLLTSFGHGLISAVTEVMLCWTNNVVAKCASTH